MLARIFWPQVIVPSLWSFALLADTKRHNELSLDENGKSPLEKFSSTTDEITCNDFHTWGCPVFVLDEANQSGLTGSPKWDPRARAGVYLGHSPSHAGNVSMVLNLKTGHVSPQYHLIFDDDFSTVAYILSGEEPPNWCKLSQNNSESVTDEKYDLAKTWYSNEATFETHDVHHNSSNDNNGVHIQPSEDLRETTQTSEDLRESGTINVHK